MLKNLIKKYGIPYIVAPGKRLYWKLGAGLVTISIMLVLVVKRFRGPKVEPKREGSFMVYPTDLYDDQATSDEELAKKLAKAYQPPASLRFIWVRFVWPLRERWKRLTRRKYFGDHRKAENGEVFFTYEIWNIHVHKMMLLWYRSIRPRIIKGWSWLSHYIRIRIIYWGIIHPIKIMCLSFWHFWGWKGTFYSWEFWYSQYYSIRTWIMPAIMAHVDELDGVFKKLIIFEWQHSIQEQTIDKFNEIYAVPMRPDSFSDFILVGVTIFTFFISLILTTLEWSEIFRNLINTFLQMWVVIIVTRMLVTVFWSQHLTMYIVLHPICFSILLFSRSLANRIILDDEDILDITCYWMGYFFIMTWMWQLDLFFIH